MNYFNLNPRVDFQLSKSNFISIRDSFSPLLRPRQRCRHAQPSDQATSAVNETNEFQIGDTWIINPHLF